ncbi:MAG: terminase large subunit [Proteobacteria bacterium]|nr:MAG: terminase large subunit [Pseudomonadota bacterium]
MARKKLSSYFKDTEYEHCYRATKYAEDVVSKKIPAGKYTILACKRQLDDLRNQTKYSFDPRKAERICRFIESMPHTKGEWAAKGETVKLEPWQSFTLTCIFGWVDEKGIRRFTDVYEEIPRKNGKSIKAAGVGNYMLAMDGEHGAEVYSGATSEKQAWEVFRPAKIMTEKSPDFKEEFGIQINAKSMVIPWNGSKFEPVIGKPGDGASPSCWILDEYHEAPDSSQRDTAKTGMGARKQPLLFIITTAGFDQYSACYDARIELTKVLEGTVVNDRMFGIIYHFDEKDDWSDPKVLAKANPNMGVSVSEQFLLDQQQDAINNPAKQNAFRTKHGNQWVGAKTAYFNMERWQKCGDDKLTIDQVIDKQAHLGADLSSHVDFTSIIHLFTEVIDGKRHYWVFTENYLPQSAIENEKTGNYRLWQEQGYINVADGEEIDFQKVEDDITEAWDKYPNIQDVAYDKHKAQQLSQRLRDTGVEMIEYPQQVLTMSPAMKELESAINSGRLHHNNDPVLTWMMSNVIAKEDRKGNVYPNKERKENKIDGAVSLIMAIGRASFNDDDDDTEDFNAFTKNPIV